MQYYRIKTNLAIPLSDNKNKTIDERMGEAALAVSRFHDALKDLNKYAKTINENDPKREKSFAQAHICKHEEGLPCMDVVDLMREEVKR